MLRKTVFLGLGSNKGDKKLNIAKTIKFLKILKKTNLTGMSSLYLSKPVGFQRQQTFLNSVVRVETFLTPYDLLRELKKIEKKIGRKKNFRNGPRLIDIDILIFEGFKIKNIRLEIPHPRLFYRPFVLVPLYEIFTNLEYNIYSYDCMRSSRFSIFKIL